MKNRNLTGCVLTLLLTGTFNISAQQHQWVQINSNTNKSLQDIEFISSNSGMAVGDKGVMIRTRDGGQSWEKLNTGTNAGFWEIISQIDNNDTITYALGDYGLIYKSGDFGNSWSKITATYHSKRLFFGMFCHDANNCFVGGGNFSNDNGVILKTTDGGKTWSESIVSRTAFIDQIYFPDKKTGYAVGSGYTQGNIQEKGIIFKTEDGGKTWDLQDTTRGLINSIYCHDANNCIATGVNGLLLKTTDGGQTWIDKHPSTGLTFLDVVFTSDQERYVVGEGAFKTEDGGETWNSIGNVNRILLSADKTAKGIFATGYSGFMVTSAALPSGLDDKTRPEHTGSIYPNPLSGNVIRIKSLNLSKPYNYKVFDLRGNMVREVKDHEGQSIDLKSVQPGVYFLHINLDAKIYVFQLVKTLNQ